LLISAQVDLFERFLDIEVKHDDWIKTGEELLKFTRACESFHKEFEINATDFNTWKNSIVLPFLEHNGIDISKA